MALAHEILPSSQFPAEGRSVWPTTGTYELTTKRGTYELATDT
jgi:hypothetical protein